MAGTDTYKCGHTPPAPWRTRVQALRAKQTENSVMHWTKLSEKRKNSGKNNREMSMIQFFSILLLNRKQRTLRKLASRDL